MQEHCLRFAHFFRPTRGKRTPLRNEPRKPLKTIQSARLAQLQGHGSVERSLQIRRKPSSGRHLEKKNATAKRTQELVENNIKCVGCSGSFRRFEWPGA
jgi:hypothetical protein